MKLRRHLGVGHGAGTASLALFLLAGAQGSLSGQHNLGAQRGIRGSPRAVPQAGPGLPLLGLGWLRAGLSWPPAGMGELWPRQTPGGERSRGSRTPGKHPTPRGTGRVPDSGGHCSTRPSQNPTAQPPPVSPAQPSFHPRLPLGSSPGHVLTPLAPACRVYCHGRWPHVTGGQRRVVTDDCLSHGWHHWPRHHHCWGEAW